MHFKELSQTQTGQFKHSILIHGSFLLTLA